ncbi:response regulator [Verticiella alkaliphila]|uniref:response regulator n=1 Tax=Verticiella alkaliphila TaxID=2779529 RepID=UPI00209B8684|nr:response regulator transcription factor [Verticiella sp. GG226]
MMRPIRVLLVDDHPLLRDGIRLGLQRDDGIQVVGEAGSVDSALASLDAVRPDVIVTDIRMPERSGLDLVSAIAERACSMRVLLLSMLDDVRLIDRALAAGAAGYVRKDAGADTLLAAIRTVAQGGRHVDPGVAALLRAPDPGVRAPSNLTPREAAVLRLVAQGLSSRDIADALDMSVRTVETHRLRVRRKLHLSTDVGLTGYVQALPEIAPAA